MNKKGWIKIIEAFIAILLITGALLIVVQKGYIGKRDISSKVYDAQKSILVEVELDESLRNEILEVSFVPAKVTASIAGDVFDLINKRKPDYLNCEAMICELDVICELDSTPAEAQDKDIYAQSRAIATTSENPNMRQLKLFCWRI